MKIIFASVLAASISFSFAQAENNIYTINSFLAKLTKGSLSKAQLYDEYIFKNEPGKTDRNQEGITYYTDTLFGEIRNVISSNNFNTYSLQSARLKFKKENLYDYYYEGQKDSIYVIAIKTKQGMKFYYALMYLNKIVSLLATGTIDNKIISWG